MPNLSHGGSGPYTYTKGETPSDPEEGETWYATGTGSQDEGAYVFNGETWVEQTVTSHEQLSDVAAWDHLDPEDVEDVVAALVAAGDNLSWTYDDAGDALQIDTTALDEEQVEDAVDGLLAAGNSINLSYDDPGDSLTVAVQNSSIGTAELSFDTATQDELDSHAGDETNPHNVSHHQTGAADSLAAHSDDANAHHSPPDVGTVTSDRRSVPDDGSTDFMFPATSITVYHQTDSGGGTFDVDYTVHFADGSSSTVTVTTDPGNTVTGTVDPNGVKFVTEVAAGGFNSTYNSGSAELEIPYAQ